MVLMDGGDKIHPIIDSYRRFMIDDGFDGVVVLLLGDTPAGIRGDAVDSIEREADVIMRREWVAAGDGHVGAGGRKHLSEHGRLRLNVHCHPDAVILEWRCGTEFGLEGLEDGHMLAGPRDLAPAGLPVIRRKVLGNGRSHAQIDGHAPENNTELVWSAGVLRRPTSR